jgi:hypothetical protein
METGMKLGGQCTLVFFLLILSGAVVAGAWVSDI